MLRVLILPPEKFPESVEGVVVFQDGGQVHNQSGLACAVIPHHKLEENRNS